MSFCLNKKHQTAVEGDPKLLYTGRWSVSWLTEDVRRGNLFQKDMRSRRGQFGRKGGRLISVVHNSTLEQAFPVRLAISLSSRRY